MYRFFARDMACYREPFIDNSQRSRERYALPGDDDPPRLAAARYPRGMTTAAPASVTWIRLVVDGAEFTIEPSPGIALSLSADLSEYDGYLDPLTRGPRPELHLSVALIPANDAAIMHCETQARRILNRLGAKRPAAMALHEFSLEAALDGEGLPYNRVSAPRLHLIPGADPAFDADLPVPSVHVFTAKAPRGSETLYTMARAQ